MSEPPEAEQIKTELAALAPRLRRFAYALCGDPEQGDDLVQTACVRALSRLAQFTPGTRLDSWMFRIVQNCFLDDRRRAQRRGAAAEISPEWEPSDEGVGARRAESRMELAQVRAAIAQLPSEQRSVLALVAIEGRSYAEAAAILNIPVGTVMSRLSRARAKLLPLISEDAA